MNFMKKIINLNKHISYNIENGQSDVNIVCSDLKIIYYLMSRGWIGSKQREGYYLRAPSVWLVDMTDPFKVNSFSSIYVNFAYYLFLKVLEKKRHIYDWIKKVVDKNKVYYKDFQFVWTEGPIVESEFRIIGSDVRVKQLKEDLFQNFWASNEYKKYLKIAQEYLGEVFPVNIKEKALEEQPLNVRKYYYELDNIFSCYNITTYNNKYIRYDLRQLGKFNKIMLSPTGCFDFLSSIIESVKIDLNKIGYYEVHSDPNKIGCAYYNCELEEDDEVIVIDKVYSGYTLDKLSRKVTKSGAKAIKVGLFPKSRAGIQKSDYVIIGNKLFEASKVSITKDWVIEYYKKAFCTDFS